MAYKGNLGQDFKDLIIPMYNLIITSVCIRPVKECEK